MTRKLSLTTAVAVAALSVGAPAAFGSVHAQAEVAPNQTQRASSVVTYLDAHERGGLATIPSRSAVTGYRDAFERPSVAVLGESGTSSIVAGYHDAYVRAAAYERSRSSAVASYRDAFERAVPPQASVPVSVPSSGTDIEWPQVGVGLGIGLLLALGLGLIMRAVHIRPFAH